MSVEQGKITLIENSAFRIAFYGALQHNGIYLEKFDNKKVKKEFKIYLKNTLKETLKEIASRKNYSHEDHYQTIEIFARKISENFHFCLRGGKMNIGTAQKMLNLYWKMTWVFDENAPIPIHCPFDGIIIRKLNKSIKHRKWTKIDDIKEYQQLVEAAQTASEGEGLAEWELKLYNREQSY
jgi:hypothetical protein